MKVIDTVLEFEVKVAYTFLICFIARIGELLFYFT